MVNINTIVFHVLLFFSPVQYVFHQPSYDNFIEVPGTDTTYTTVMISRTDESADEVNLQRIVSKHTIRRPEVSVSKLGNCLLLLLLLFCFCLFVCLFCFVFLFCVCVCVCVHLISLLCFSFIINLFISHNYIQTKSDLYTQRAFT